MFKRASGPAKRSFRKRDREEALETGSGVVQGIKREAKRGATFRMKNEDVSDDEEERATSAVWASNRTVERVEHRGGALEHSEVDVEQDKDARALLERKLRLEKEGKVEAGVYRGANNYKSFVKVKESQIGGNKYTGTKGPIRAPQFVRNTCRFDYQPDVCKDYKLTGFCGYGDSCKFLHDRGDYKTGWQLEAEHRREMERKKEREMAGKLGYDSDEERERDKYRVRSEGEDDDIPFACHICLKAFDDPMQTLCGHYFCTRCASERFRSGNSRCAVCDKQTSGVLNAAPKLKAKAKAVGGFQRLFEMGSKTMADLSPPETTTTQYAAAHSPSFPR
ncbi:hypothetical protein CTAYLR_006708 [Chrysophaeum taylorii]|uniref:RING-type E3 ubiquitin transferase n=1 Tax=Chrysophaeum taylorii TaxID=2483200 RepID=A0AAD7UB25_9STRA|nr:hypothetical protein CTAYLR_006708 [Chrysophaeum taylorii]